jgi:hypothetical protein
MANPENAPSPVIVENIPSELVDRPQWVTWRSETRDGTSLPTKVPYDARTGWRASSNDSSTWAPFEVALTTYRAKGYSGVGFMLAPPHVGVDLDKCMDPGTGELDPVAAEIVRELDSYTEVSPSGRGLHTFVRGTLPKEHRRKGRIEMYDGGRYFTVTGARLEGTPATITERSEALLAVHSKVFGGSRGVARLLPRVGASHLDDGELIERARRAKNGAAFEALVSGSWHGKYPSQSEADLALCSHLAFWTNHDPERIDRIFRRSGLFREKWDEKHRSDGRTYGQGTIDKALERAGEGFVPSGEHASSLDPEVELDDRPAIAETGDLKVMVDAAEDVLVAANVAIYHRGGELARIQAKLGNRPTIKPIPLRTLQELLSEFSVWLGGKNGDKHILPPSSVVETLAVRGHWRLPELNGIVEHPVLRPDGSVLDTPGYDQVSRLYLVSFETFQTVPSVPTREEALAALAELSEVYCDFPFVADSDRSAAISVTLTLVGRPAIDGPTPMFVVRSPERGSGKTLIVDAASTIAMGTDAPRMVQVRNPDEEAKRILALGREGATLALIDNVEHPLGSDVLSAALTGTTFKGRVLGHSVTAEVPVPVFAATGCNLMVQGDLGRRVIPIDLDAKVERPDERGGFVHASLLEWVRAERLRLLRAALTILRWYVVERRPTAQLTPFGSYEAWSGLIRAPLVLLGKADPCAGRERIREAGDADLEALRIALSSWYAIRGAQPMTANELVSLAVSNREMRDALTELCEGKDPNTRHLGYVLKKYRNRIVDGLRLERSGEDRKKCTRWCVVRVSQEMRPPST